MSPLALIPRQQSMLLMHSPRRAARCPLTRRRRGQCEPRPGQRRGRTHTRQRFHCGSAWHEVDHQHTDSPKHKASPLGSNDSIKDRDSERMTPRGFGTCCVPHPLSQVKWAPEQGRAREGDRWAGSAPRRAPCSHAGRVRRRAGLVKADGGAQPTGKIHLLGIRPLDKSMNHELLQVCSLGGVFY